MSEASANLKSEISNPQSARGHFKRWRIAPPHERADALAGAIGVPWLVAQLLCRRGMSEADAAQKFLSPKLTDLHDPALLPGCTRAAERIVAAIKGRQPIVIYGDYDVDGVTATAILFHIIRALDPQADVRRYVPHRIDEGYGLNTAAIEKLCDSGAAVIVTVDCGITAVEPAAAAKARGADLIVTDHHTMNETLPDAHTLVHPRLPGSAEYPFPDICGAGVAYKLAWQTARTWCGTDRLPEVLRDTLVDLLPLAALGTIADVVPLVGENRVLTMFGLGRIKHTPFTGLNALIDASRLRDEKIDSYHVGFVLGPRLNACGRMGHAREAVKLLTDAAGDEAARIAEFLNGENDRRRVAERRIFEQAKAMVMQEGYHEESCRAIVLSHDEWHAGVVGIVCSRLVEAFGKPAVLLSTANGEAHGSARSIDGFNIHEAFTACASHLTSYGGHAMAAGLKLPRESVAAFREALLAHAADRITPEQMTPVIELDAEVRLGDLATTTVEQIQKLQPFGRDNRDPRVLVSGVQLKQPANTMGRESRHLSLIAHQNGAAMRCVAWNMGGLKEKLPAGTTLDLAAEPKINDFNGRRSVELVIHDLRWKT